MSRFETPCMREPEVWTSDQKPMRDEAALACLGCWRFAECAAEAESNRPEFGVVAGVDYSKKDGRSAEESAKLSRRVCEDPTCARHLTRGYSESISNFRKRRFCSRSCGNKRNGSAAA